MQAAIVRVQVSHCNKKTSIQFELSIIALSLLFIFGCQEMIGWAAIDGMASSGIPLCVLRSFISDISTKPNLSCFLPIPLLASYAFLGGAVKHPGVGAHRRQWLGFPCWLHIQKYTTRSRHRSSRQRCTSWHWHSSQEHWQPTHEWIPLHCIARDEWEHCWYQGILTWRTENSFGSRTSAWTNSVRDHAFALFFLWIPFPLSQLTHAISIHSGPGWYKIVFDKPIEPDTEIRFGIKIAYTHVLENLPASIKQLGRQYVYYSENIYVDNPYFTDEIKTTLQ